MKRLKLKYKEVYIYILSFIIPVILMSVIYALLGIYPVGNKTIINSDMYLQYVGFLARIKDILSGDAGLFYTFSKSLGGNTTGLFAYYMASPLNLIIALFPKSYIAEAIAIITLIKIGLASLTFTVYLIVTFKRKDISLLILSLCYAFMSYNINFQLNIMWLDGVILLPLVILGIDKLINEDKFKLYVITLFLAIVSNYYIGYMICIFSVLYFIYKIVLNNKVNLKKIGKFLGGSLLSAVLSAFILIPTVLSLNSGKATFRLFQEAPKLLVKPGDIIARLFMGNFSLNQIMGNYPNIYCGVIITVLILMYFVNKNISRKERILSGIFMFVLFFSISISTLVLIWHGFDYPVGFGFRFSFLISFLSITLAYREFIIDGNISKLKIGVMLLLGIVCTVFVLYRNYDGLSQFKVFMTLFFYIIYIVLIKICRVVDKNKFAAGKYRQAIKVILIFIVFSEVSINAYSCLKLRNFVSRTRIYNYINEMQPIVNELKENMDNFYRMEEVFVNTYDDPMMLNYYGITHSSSSNDSNTREFMSKMGIKTSSIFEKYNRGSLITIDSLLGVKYQINSRKSEDFSNYHYTENKYYNKVLEENSYTVYENPFALPIAFMVNDSLKDVDTLEGNTFELNNSILSSMINSKSEINRALDISEITSENLKSTKRNGEICYEKINKYKESSITFTVRAIDTNPVYIFLKSKAYENGIINYNQVSVSINGIEKFTVFDSGNYNVEYIGAFNRGDEIKIKVSLKMDKFSLDQLQVYSCNISEFKEVYDELNNNIIRDTEYRDGYIYGNVSISDDKTLLYTSIPYDEGWSLIIDGKKAEYIKILDGLIGVELDEGEHSIEFKYHVPGLRLGSIISIIGLISVCLYVYYNKRMKIKLFKSV